MSKSGEDYIPGLGTAFFLNPNHIDKVGGAETYIPGLGTDFTIKGEHVSEEGGMENYLPGLGAAFKVDYAHVIYDYYPEAVTSTGSGNGELTIDVVGADELATITLYDLIGVLVGTITLTGVDTTCQFTSVAPGMGYYVVQTVGGADSPSSNIINVAPPPVVATGSIGGVQTIDVADATKLAILLLFNAANAQVGAYTLVGDATTHTFAEVPIAAGWYVKQVVNGSYSTSSNVVEVA